MALDRLPAGFALAYIDDIICHSQSVEDHLDHVEQVMEIYDRLYEAKIEQMSPFPERGGIFRVSKERSG